MNTKLRKLSIVVAVLLITGTIFSVTSGRALAQGRIAVESKVDQSTMNIGDVIRYTIIMTRDADVQIQTPMLAVNLGQFEIRDYKVLEPQKKENQIIEQTDYLISTFDTGEYEIPSIEIGYSTAKDTTLDYIKTEPIKILVESLNPDNAGDIRDIKPPIEPLKDYSRLIIVAIVCFFVLLLVVFLIYYIKRRKQGKSLLPKRQEPPRPAHEIAFGALEALVASDLLAKGRVKEYYIELSDILRNYVQGRYYITALEKTTSELIESMNNEEVPSDHVNVLHAFLSKCDMVKFAKYVPADSENSETTQLGFDFVNATKLVVVEETETASEIDFDKEEDKKTVSNDEELVQTFEGENQ